MQIEHQPEVGQVLSFSNPSGDGLEKLNGNRINKDNRYLLTAYPKETLILIDQEQFL